MVGPYRLSKIWVKLQHVVKLFLQRSGFQSFVFIILQKICLQKEQRGWGLRPKSPLRCSQPGKPALSLRPLVSTRTGGVRGDGLECLYKPCELFSLFLSFSQQADLALQEAIRIAQESNDHVCLQHCLVNTFFYSISSRHVTVVPWLMGHYVITSELALHTGTNEGIRQHRVNRGFSKNGCPFLPASECKTSLFNMKWLWLFFFLLLNCFGSLFTVVSVCKTLTAKCCYPYFSLKISKHKFLRENSHC